MEFPGQNTGVGSHSLLQGIFPTQGMNPGLPHCRQILCQLSRQGSPNYERWFSIKGHLKPPPAPVFSCFVSEFALPGS